MGKEKVNINIVVIGHVGSGKSTTIGRLIYNFGLIDKHVIEKLKKEGAEMNQNSFNYVGVAERGRDISIDNGMWELETDKYHFTFIHAHGHAEFIKNMMTGASRADCALLVVDSTSTGGFEVDIFGNGRTPEHTLIKPLNVICCCNRMDAADYSKERYDEIVKSTSPCLKNLGYNPAKIPFVPISGLEGDNLIERSNNLPWYEGPTLLEALHQIQDPKTPSDKSLEKKEHPNGGKSIKSAAMRRGKKFGTAIVKGGKKLVAAMVTGGKKSLAAIVEGGKKFGPPCLNACVVGGIQAAVALAT
ncbi:elongation factor 1-alpha [Ziziphus jujuba]|uniref:Elongation factor 1-alpha n=1 Tax=Ziziphus jujuba TaxID=326968 RepID=A0ABM4A3P4_ZIZJJ|nr:elongation factor 1-alpha-like [Ziziphus jujuba var. spinosa]XP_060671345.1 elongation factor 1-alpha [Ziziphus jujuba]